MDDIVPIGIVMCSLELLTKRLNTSKWQLSPWNSTEVRGARIGRKAQDAAQVTWERFLRNLRNWMCSTLQKNGSSLAKFSTATGVREFKLLFLAVDWRAAACAMPARLAILIFSQIGAEPSRQV